MKRQIVFCGLVLTALPAFGQVSINIDQALAQADMQLQAIDSQQIAQAMQKAQAAMASVAPLASLAPRAPLAPRFDFQFAQSNSNRATGDFAYDSGTRALDERKYDDAIRQFDRVVAAKSSRSDGALYWKAYALNRLGKRDEAVAAIAALRRDYPASRWLNDAQALEVEAKQNSGRPVSPNDEVNDDVKLIALNSIMRADPERAVPQIEAILKSSSTPKLKDRAMFVLTQSKTPRAQQVLSDYAKGSTNPDLQMRAIRYIGMSGTPEAQQQLASIYSSSNDVDVKKAILRSLFTADASDRLLDLARNEKDSALRVEAIRDLSLARSAQSGALTGLYPTADAPAKKEIVEGLFRRGDAKDLVDLARKESDGALKRTIVERLGSMHSNKEATDYMLELLK